MKARWPQVAIECPAIDKTTIAIDASRLSNDRSRGSDATQSASNARSRASPKASIEVFASPIEGRRADIERVQDRERGILPGNNESMDRIQTQSRQGVLCARRLRGSATLRDVVVR